MNTPAALALVQALLIPNLCRLPIVIMILMIQGIHPEIIFELVPHVQISQRQYHAIIMAWTQLRLFASLLPAVKGVKPQTFQGQRSRFRKFPQDPVSRVFARFQNEVILKRLERLGFAGTLPSLEVVQQFASNLGVVRMSPCQIFPIGQLFLTTKSHLVLLKTALQMQSMIAHVRSSYPDIVSFLSLNENALKNICMVWKNQMDVKNIAFGRLYDILEPIKINDLFIFCILAVIDPAFDRSLTQVIQNCGYPSEPYQNIQKYYQFLKDNCKSIEPMIFGNFLNIGSVLDLFSTMVTSTLIVSISRYALKPWSMAFGQILYSGQPEFEEVTIELGTYERIFDVFSRFWDVFFRNFARTFEVSFLPFGNIPWSEGYTRLCTTEFDWIIQIAVKNFALLIGKNDDHRFLRSEISWMSNRPHSGFTTASYARLIFPDGIRNSRMSSEICSCFLRDFLRAHRKPDPNMSDVDYIKWLFSIPGTFKVFGKDWIQLMDALQNGTELPRVMDGSSGDFGYLSRPTVETDPKVQDEYNKNFGKVNSRISVSDYFD